MTPTRIYHNPRCGSSRRALELLRGRGIEPEVIEYLKTPPTKTEIRALLKMLGLKPRDLMRMKEREFEALGLKDAAKKDDELIAAMAEHPILIERPVVVQDGRAVIARPPEKLLELLR